MIFKGQVIDIELNYAIVLTDDMEYKRVVKKKNMCIGMSIMFLKEDIYINKKQKIKALYGLAAVLIFMFVSIQMFGKVNYLGNVTASLVSIDINPSIELGVSQKGLVTEIRSFNDEGSSLLKEIPRGLELSETVISILKNAYADHYLDQDDSMVLIALAALNQNNSEELMHQQEKIKYAINSSKQLANTSIEYIFTETENIEFAHQNELSIGRFGIYQNLKNDNESLTVASIKKMHVGELLRRRKGTTNETFENEDEPEDEWNKRYRNGLKDESDDVGIPESDGNETGEGDKRRVRKGFQNQGNQGATGSEDPVIQESVQTEAVIEELEEKAEEISTPENKGQNIIEVGSGQEGQNGDVEHDKGRESGKADEEENEGVRSKGEENKREPMKPKKSVNKN